MKEIQGISRNIFFGNEGDEIEPFVEVVISVSEPQLQCDPGGDFRQVRIPESYRFVGTAVALRKIARRLHEFADEGEEVLREALEQKTANPVKD